MGAGFRAVYVQDWLSFFSLLFSVNLYSVQSTLRLNIHGDVP